MAYDHGNYDYSHGLLPKIHFKENRYNTPNSGAMKPIKHPKDRHGYDRSQFSPKKGCILMVTVQSHIGPMIENKTHLPP